MASKYPNSGTLGKNDRKQKDSDPNLSGKCEVAGVEYWLSGWTKTGKDGSKFISLSFRPKDASAKPAAPAKADYDDSDIPF